MRVLLTGANGYVGKRILPILVNQGHFVVCCVRDVNRFSPPQSIKDRIDVIQVDFLKRETLTKIPKDIDAAYYLMHSMSIAENYEQLEHQSAINFKDAIETTNAYHVIYLSGIVNDDSLSKHLSSRKVVEDELAKGTYHFTALRAGIIIGSGSASFEIIRDLVEKLPVMVAPKWLKTKCQPIGISDVIEFLTKSLCNPITYGQNFDIGGSDVLTYQEMLQGYAKIRKLKRHIYIVPVLTPRLSSYWLYFVTSTSYKLAMALVDSMRIEVVCRNTTINELLNIEPISYENSLKKAFAKIDSNQIVSSWKDSLVSGRLDFNISDFIEVPTYGCFIDKRQRETSNVSESVKRIWAIGGKTGWYYGNWLWHIRGFIDKLMGGVGLRRGRTNAEELEAGDAIDFWRVIYANKIEKRLLLYAEMKLPGEAWLEFRIVEDTLYQTATFRPKGLFGRMYWFLVYPLHGFIFKGMISSLTK